MVTCNICGTSFARADNLKRHMQTVHGSEIVSGGGSTEAYQSNPVVKYVPSDEDDATEDETSEDEEVSEAAHTADEEEESAWSDLVEDAIDAHVSDISETNTYDDVRPAIVKTLMDLYYDQQRIQRSHKYQFF